MRTFPWAFAAAAIGVSFAAAGLVSGCASVALAPEASQAIARQLTPPANRSYIYIVRRGRGLGAAIYEGIALDGKVVGALSNDTFVLIEVEPREHQIFAYATDNKNGNRHGMWGIDFSQSKVLGVSVNCLPGKSYFFSASIGGGGPGGTELLALSDEEGRDYVRKYDMAATSSQPSE